MLNSQFPILIGWEFRIEHWSDPMRLCPISKILEIHSTEGFSMTRRVFPIAVLIGTTVLLHAQSHAPYAPFTAEQATLGKELAAKSIEIRRQITNLAGPADPFKIIGNLYFVGNANGEVFLLTSPQGHIMMGAGAAESAEKLAKLKAAVR